MSKGKAGKIKATMEEVQRVIDSHKERLASEAGNSMFNFPGSFSPLDEVIQQSKQARMPGTDWAKYVRGRPITRAGMQFMPTAEELMRAGPAFDELVANPSTVGRDQLLGALRQGREHTGLTVTGIKKGQDIVTRLNRSLGADDDSIALSRFNRALSNSRPRSLNDLRALANRYGLDFRKDYDAPSPGVAMAQEPYNYLSTRTPGSTDLRTLVSNFDPKLYGHNYSHFPDASSWSRMSSVPGPRGEGRAALIDEIQSDIHQRAGKEGAGYLPYRSSAETPIEALTQNQLKNFGELEPPVPGMGNAWIDHELKKDLFTSILSGDSRLAVVSPKTMETRYGRHEGRGKFYGDMVNPKFESLMKKYNVPMEEAVTSATIDPNLNNNNEALEDILAQMKGAEDNQRTLPVHAIRHISEPYRLGIDADLFTDPELRRHALGEGQYDHGTKMTKAQQQETKKILESYAQKFAEEMAQGKTTTRRFARLTDPGLIDEILKRGFSAYAQGGQVA